MSTTKINLDSKEDMTDLIYGLVDENFIFDFSSMVGYINFNELSKEDFIQEYTLSDMDIILYDLNLYIQELDSKGYVEEKKLTDHKKYKTSKVKEKEISAKTVDKRSEKMTRTGNKYSVKKRNLTDEIYNLVEENSIFNLTSMVGEINFDQKSKDEFIEAFTTEEIELIHNEVLIYIDEIETDEILIDQLELIKKYENGEVREKEEKTVDESWRKEIPSFIKRLIPDWKTSSIEIVYERMKSELSRYSGDKNQELIESLAELSRIVFSDDPDDIVDDENTHSVDDLADSVMRIIEMIILPHKEILDKLKVSGGRVKFADIWNEHFSEELKSRVKDRDGWKCVVCENDVNLHVHHKIPRALGGINHMTT